VQREEAKFSQKGNSMREAVIVSAARTPVGRYLGALRDIPAYDLAALVLNEVLKRRGASAEAVKA
jgi:acetyl-CoA C-acetyltransferase